MGHIERAGLVEQAHQQHRQADRQSIKHRCGINFMYSTRWIAMINGLFFQCFSLYGRAVSAVPFHYSLLAWLAIPLSTFAADEVFSEASMVPVRITIRHARFRRPVTDYYEGYLFGISSTENKPRATGIVVSGSRDVEADWSPARANSYRYRVSYPPLHKGDLVPMFGVLYRVAEFSYPNTGSRGIGGAVGLKRAKDDEVPAGAHLQRDSFYFPIGGGGQLHQAILNEVKLVETPDRPDESAAVSITTIRDHSEIDRRFTPRANSPQVHVLRVGDWLDMAGTSHRVRNIVPPEPQQQLHGWIEFEPTPSLPPERR